MTTKDFIAKNYNVGGRERRCSSVTADANGYIYSYGSHYPLAFQVGGLDFINEAGYSNTTSRHIHWAKSALDYNYVGVKLNRHDANIISTSFFTDEEKLGVLRSALERELLALNAEIDAKKRKHTEVYRNLLSDAQDVRDDLRRVKDVIYELV